MADDENLAVDVPVTDDEEYDEEEAMRAQAMINSPKGDNNALSYEQNENDNGMSLNLTVEDEDEDYNENNVTPNTKARDNYDVNSPRAKKQQWAGDDNDGAQGSGVAGLVTQVQRPDTNSSGQSGGGGVESLVTQVPRDDDDTERDIQKNMSNNGGGLCACLSCLWSCCGSDSGKADLQMQSGVNGGSGIDSSNANGYSNGGNGPLLENKTNDGTTTQTQRSNNSEDSISSTDYSHSLLPPLKPEFIGKKCLVLDLDETLVHSSFKPIPKPDFIIPVEIDRVVHHVYVLKRPYVDEFLLRCSKHYEIVIFTASLSKYADPLLDKLDIHNVIEARLFRESCVIHGTAYVKDMRRIGRKLKDSIIVDNSPPSYLFQPTNAVPIASWFDDPNDTQLLDFCPVLETTMKDIDDVRKLLDANNKSFRWLCNQAHQPLSKYTVRNDRANRQ